MKYSIYNTKLLIDGKHTLFFNAFSGKSVVVKNKLIESVDLDSIATESSRLYSQMCEAGIAVEDNIDEYERLLHRVVEGDNNRNQFILHINPTLDCNFHCWYCYEKHIAGSKMDESARRSVEKFVLNTLNEQEGLKYFDIGFFGGEPLMHFNDVARPLIEFTAAQCLSRGITYRVSFTTNAGLLDDDMADFLSQHNCGFQITLDGGRTDHNNTRFSKGGAGSFDTIVANIHKLATRRMEVITRVNYTSRNIGSVMDILESFNSLETDARQFVRFDFQRVWQERAEGYSADTDQAESYITEIRQAFRQAGFDVLVNYIPHSGASSCYGDKLNHVLINYNGDTYGCTARDFNRANRLGHLNPEGRVITDNTQAIERRNTSKLAKAVCRTCRIAPICSGGCKQRAVEGLNDESCTFGYTDSDMDNIVVDIVDHCLDTAPK